MQFNKNLKDAVFLGSVLFYFVWSESEKERLFPKSNIRYTFAVGEMAEWSNAAVLKTVVRQRTGGSNPSFSATEALRVRAFFIF